MNQDYYDQERADEGWNKLPDALQKLGYTELRGPQKPCIKTIFGGQDVFCVLATGGGKTALAAIPTIVYNYQTIIFSPLIALMKDQVDSLNRKGIRAGALNSTQSDTENWHVIQAWLDRRCQVLFVAPERINKPEFQAAMRQAPPGLVVVDEAHTMSQWSVNFRPSYTQCGEFVRQFQPRQVIALTATATKNIIEDVISIMGTNNMILERHYEERSNLQLSSSFVDGEAELYTEVLKKVRQVEGSAIVYCSTVKQVAAVTAFLAQSGESVTFYHGQISDVTVKDRNQDTFMQNRARIMVATNAFGMGIDKPDIEAIIHASPPGSIEAVSQEIGRAARDGRKAICHIFGSSAGYWMQEFLWSRGNPPAASIQAVERFIRHNMDANQELEMTGEDIATAIDDEAASAAMNHLVSIGCLERHAPEGKVATITICEDQIEQAPKAALKTLNLVRQYGLHAATSGNNNPVYKICLNYLRDKANCTLQTVQNHIRQLVQKKVILYTAPFNGKITKFIREVTPLELAAAEIRRHSEREKFQAVRDYIKCPDEQKHQFLNKYFSL